MKCLRDQKKNVRNVDYPEKRFSSSEDLNQEICTLRTLDLQKDILVKKKTRRITSSKCWALFTRWKYGRPITRIGNLLWSWSHLGSIFIAKRTTRAAICQLNMTAFQKKGLHLQSLALNQQRSLHLPINVLRKQENVSIFD